MYNFLENKLDEIGNNIHFDYRNRNVFSIELFNILFSSSNLFEICAKRLVKDDTTNMGDWRKHDRIKKLGDEQVSFIPMRGHLIGQVMNFIDDTQRVPWWDSYNAVKHDYGQLQYATLENAINSLASAGLMVNYVMEEERANFKKEPSLLYNNIYKWKYKGTEWDHV
jgi:hypothetical protein